VIYRATTALEDRRDILAIKLIAGKVTYVHQRLSPAVVAVGCAREPWQLHGLSSVAEWLLQQTDAEGEIQTNDLLLPADMLRKSVPMAARELERRLLVYATEIHTPTGAHAKVLETWQHWAVRTGFKAAPLSVAEGKRALQEAAARLAAGTGRKAQLPWPTFS
jgi:hypothetical protein